MRRRLLWLGFPLAWTGTFRRDGWTVKPLGCFGWARRERGGHVGARGVGDCACGPHPVDRYREALILAEAELVPILDGGVDPVEHARAALGVIDRALSRSR